MSLIQLQELNGQYLDALTEGLHKLLEVAAANRHYKDVSVISAALESLKAQENVTEIGYRDSRYETRNEVEGAAEEPPKDMESCIENLVKTRFMRNMQLSSRDLISVVHNDLKYDNSLPDYTEYNGKTQRPYWKVCVEKATEKLLKEGAISKASRYKYVSNIYNVHARSD